MMKKFALLVLALAAVAACGGSPTHGKTAPVRAGGPEAPRCAELILLAEASPRQATSGALACLNPEVRQAFADQAHVTTDRELAEYAAADPVYAHYASCGFMNDFYFFDLVTPDGKTHRGVKVRVDEGSGLITGFSFSPYSLPASTCPPSSGSIT